MKVVYSQPSNPCCETFVEPKLLHDQPNLHDLVSLAYLIPPIHCDKVTKPLMSQLVSNHVSDSVLVPLVRLLLIEQQGGCT